MAGKQVPRDQAGPDYEARGHCEPGDSAHEALGAPGPAARRQGEKERRDSDRQAGRKREVSRTSVTTPAADVATAVSTAT